MFESEGDKKKKVYPRLPDMLGKKDTPYYIYVLYDASLEETYAALRLKRLCIIFLIKTYCITFFPSLMTIPW